MLFLIKVDLLMIQKYTLNDLNLNKRLGNFKLL